MQWRTGGTPSTNRDVRVLNTSVREFSGTEVCVSGALKALEVLSRSIDASHPSSFETAEALSVSILSRIWEASYGDSTLNLIQSKIASSTPKPYLVPLRYLFTPPSEVLEVDVNIGAECVDYSPCGRYVVVGTLEGGVVVVEAEASNIIKKLSFHTDPVSVVKFTSSLEATRMADGPLWPSRRLTGGSVVGASRR